MTGMGYSKFIEFEDSNNIIWNERLITSKISPLSEFNDVSQMYVEKLTASIADGLIKVRHRTECICGSNAIERISTYDRFGLCFSTYICTKCGIIMTSPFIEENSLMLYYNEYYHQMHFGKEEMKEQEALFRVGQGEKIYGIMRNSISERSDIYVLEIGAGTGSVLYEFKEAAKREGIKVNIYGTEYSDECIDECKKNGVTIIRGGINEALEMGIEFDVVILSHVLEHFVDPHKELSTLKKAINGHSIIYIEVPGVMTLHKKSEYQYDYIKYTTHAHMYNYNLTTLTNIMNDVGFKLIYGNEEVESLFEIGTQRVCVKSNYANTLCCLKFYEQNLTYFNSEHNALIIANEKLNSMLHHIPQTNQEGNILGKLIRDRIVSTLTALRNR